MVYDNSKVVKRFTGEKCVKIRVGVKPAQLHANLNEKSLTPRKLPMSFDDCSHATDFPKTLQTLCVPVFVFRPGSLVSVARSTIS